MSPLIAVVLGYRTPVHVSTSPSFPFIQALLTCKGEQWVSFVTPEMGMVLLAASRLAFLSKSVDQGPRPASLLTSVFLLVLPGKWQPG